MKKTTSFLLVLLLSGFMSHAQKKSNVLSSKQQVLFTDSEIDQLLLKLTDEEKVALVIGRGMDNVGNLGVIDGRVPGAGGQTHDVKRLGIPDIIVCDGPSGLRINPIREGSTKTFYATAFPCETVLGSTWSKDLARQLGNALGTEAKEYGIDVLLAPGVNIHRNPLGGRNFEYISEDPILSGVMASNLINAVQQLGVGTSLKHYAANNAENNRLFSNSLVSERAMRELYLRPFELAVKGSQPWTIMTSYNKINSQYTSERRDLNYQILREEWGFKGLVMTDWYSGFPSVEVIRAGNQSNDVSAQIRSGNDLIMPGSKIQLEAALKDVKSGKLSKKDLDFAVRNVLRVVSKSPSPLKYKYSDAPDLQSHATLSRMIAAEGTVMLKNAAALPLKTNTRIATFGVGSYHLVVGGTGSSEVTTSYNVPVYKGLQNANYTLHKPLLEKYVPYVELEEKKDKERRAKLNALAPLGVIAQLDVTDHELNDAVANTDVAILTFGRNSAEEQDLNVDTEYNLTKEEEALLNRVSAAYKSAGKKVIVVLNIGSVMNTSWDDKADALLVTWFSGAEGGNALADIVSGKVNPSAKTTATFPKSYADVPSAKSFYATPASEHKDIHYTEGIYVGYRYYDTFNIATAYPFGFGLSYTSFNYSDLKLDAKEFKNQIKATVKVTNSGRVAGKEAVQLYVATPKGSIDKPAKVLVDFGKTKLLQPGESQILEFVIGAKEIASFHTEKSQWIADAGVYQVLVGKSSQDIALESEFSITSTKMIEKVTPAFTEQLDFSDLKK
ncbi:glycoside hydrolase family 3 C-terminal domain-containing protein [Sphingobacterium sp. JUb56]|uniref:glycoside hydrolase family 3 C-terminal domain-containing protein n=1 Tax=Sphingobacterium sp. JUb56 TaxID=2587145 RepID=UPI00161E7A56|nr:glycoside hydrolase family 3 N-terminal domain-containing protein [Sphingobacterium sp. JUb56]MBB2951214.1 beta-glucosidase [Sphingobacterium sp. JUb56]